MPGALSRWGLDAQQRVHDASLHLQMLRARHCHEIEAGRRSTGAQVVPGGLPVMREHLTMLFDNTHELLAVTAYPGDVQTFRRTHEANRVLVERGMVMLSLFNSFGLEDAVRDLIVQAESMPYFLACGPLQMKVLDRRCVVVEGPVVDGDRSLLLLNSPEAVAAGMRYIRAVRATSVPAAGFGHRTDASMTPRQEAIAEMLSAGLNDDMIAESLGVSVRTVRADVAGLMSSLGTPTRFSAGRQYAQLKQSLG
jgi:DNA-binding CsgD family transcriptional regulator